MPVIELTTDEITFLVSFFLRQVSENHSIDKITVHKLGDITSKMINAIRNNNETN